MNIETIFLVPYKQSIFISERKQYIFKAEEFPQNQTR